MRKQKNNSAFTLIELLVVIAIISLLVSILLPSLHAAKEQAQITACMANEKSVGSGIFMYASESDGYPPESWDGIKTWGRKLIDMQCASLFRCPAHMPVFGTDDLNELCSYALNSWTTLQPGNNEFGGDGYYARARYRSIDEVTQPAISGLAVEVWRSYNHLHGDYDNTIDCRYGEINNVFCLHNINFCKKDIGLHGEDRKQNILFYDGHVETYPFVYPADGTIWPENQYGWKWYLVDDGL